MLPLAAKVTVRASNTARPAAWAMRHEAGVVKRRRACCRYHVQRVARPWSLPATIIRLAIANASSHSSRVQSVASILETGAVAPRLRAAFDMSLSSVGVRSAGVFPALPSTASDYHQTSVGEG